MTSQGSAYGRLRRALDRRNTLAALSAATELPHVGLTDALELLLLLADEDEERRFRRAAVRWASRYYRDVPGVEPAEAQAGLGLTVMLGGERRVQAACALVQLVDRRTQLPASEILLRLADEGAAQTQSPRRVSCPECGR